MCVVLASNAGVFSLGVTYRCSGKAIAGKDREASALWESALVICCHGTATSIAADSHLSGSGNGFGGGFEVH
jgi:hypothetical protein